MQIRVGDVAIGGGAPVVVQSMTLTKTHDAAATTAQIAALASAGCEIVRVAVPKNEDAAALPLIVRLSPIPVIADIHFNASLALKAIEAGVAAVRINPGNIGGPDKVEQVVRSAKRAGIPMRIGANSGSLPKHLFELAQQDQAEALVAAALEEVELLEKLEYRDFKISVKATHVPTMIRAYRMLAAKVPYPLHLGVTEAGTEFAGAIKSSVGIGSLEDLFAIWTWGGSHEKPGGLLNRADYYTGLLRAAPDPLVDRFFHETRRGMLIVDRDPAVLLRAMSEFRPPETRRLSGQE